MKIFDLAFLTLYHKILEESFRKYRGKRRKCLYQASSPFPSNVFYPSQNIWQIFQSQIFCCLKDLSILTSLKICHSIMG